MVKIGDPITAFNGDVKQLESEIIHSYTTRVKLCERYLKLQAGAVQAQKEENLRYKNPALQDAYEQYQMLLKLVKEEHDLL
ncbi:MAG: hypothetical protein DRQ47_04480 [Gammaproteobacteria bacterium]|nr:MAG: hypothetical protein DRQ47_04480 [Gammaproteobacteria bacterium]